MLMASLSMTSIVGASPLTPQDALSRALNNGEGKRMSTAAQFTANDLVYTEFKDLTPTAYIFSKPEKGFILVSADDVAVPVLGYSDEGVIDPTNIPENMAWWLSQYSEEIAAAKNNGTMKGANKFESRQEKAAIKPMCTTKWNQSAPYYNMCPKYGSSYCMTGCVATAMAQVMKYHNWPDVGTGSINYTWTLTSQKMSMDFTTATFDWDNMLDGYNGVNATTAQKNAVALLMKACGYSVKMNYSTSASGAQCSDVAPALVNYFKYGKETTCANRQYFKLYDWENLIYESLANDAPVFYSGTNESSGHAFVCDGYSSDGYFHFNWGWSGASDGYFVLTALDPESQGIGGSASGYNSDQSAMLMVKPITDNSDYLRLIVCHSTFGASYASSGRTLTLYGNYLSMATGSVTVAFGAEFTDANGNKTYARASSNNTIPSWSYRANYKVTVPTSLEPGEYVVRPVYVPNPTSGDTSWKYVYTGPGDPGEAYLTVDANGDITVREATQEKVDLKVTDVNINTALVSGKKFSVTATVNNPSSNEKYTKIYAALVSGDNLSDYSSPIIVDLESGESKTMTVETQFTKGAAAGNYNFAFIEQYTDGTTKYISDFIPVTLQSVGTTKVSVQNFTIHDSTGVNCTDINCTLDLKCTSGYFASIIYALLCDSSRNYLELYCTTPTLYVMNGETKSFDFNVAFDGLNVGSRYYLVIQTLDEYLTEQAFTVKDNVPAGVEAVEAESGIEVKNGAVYVNGENLLSAVVYAIDGHVCSAEVRGGDNGAVIDLSSLPSGVYMVNVNTLSGMKTVKVMK